MDYIIGASQHVLREFIRDLYDGVRTRVRTVIGDTEDFSINIGLHQGSALNPFFFITIMDELTREIQDEIP